MLKNEFFYPNKFTNNDYKIILDQSLIFCKFALIKCINNDCHDNHLLKKITPHINEIFKIEVSEKFTEYQYLINLNKESLSDIKNYSKSINSWSTQGDPEDLSFLDKNKSYWFSSIVHENDFFMYLNVNDLDQEIYREKLCPTEYTRIFPYVGNEYYNFAKKLKSRSLKKYFSALIRAFTKMWNTIEKESIPYDETNISGIANIYNLEKYFHNYVKDKFYDPFNFFIDDINSIDKKYIADRIVNLITKIESFEKKNSKVFSNFIDKSIKQTLQRNLLLEESKLKYPKWDCELLDMNITDNENRLDNLKKLKDNSIRE